MDVSRIPSGRRLGLVLQGEDDCDVDKIFQHFFSQENLFSTIPHTVWSPPTDVYETPDHYIVRMEIPGLDSGDDVEIELRQNVLTIRGHRPDKSADTKLNFLQMEIHYGYFEKVVTLPHGIDPDRREAKYADGFLCIRIGRVRPEPRILRRIPIDS